MSMSTNDTTCSAELDRIDGIHGSCSPGTSFCPMGPGPGPHPSPSPRPSPSHPTHSHTPGGETIQVFRFGDVFFKSFYTAFNIPQAKMGFAVNKFAASGTKIIQTPSDNSIGCKLYGLILGLAFGILLLIIVAASVYCYMKKKRATAEKPADDGILTTSLTAQVYES